MAITHQHLIYTGLTTRA